MDLASVNDMVLEYLLFRGYTRTFKSLVREGDDDRLCAFHSTKVVDAIFGHIEALDMRSFRELWAFLDARFFAHLDREHALSLERCRQRLLRLYVVTCVKRQRRDEATAFFARYHSELEHSSPSGPNDSWRHWFALPFLSDPREDPEFGVYFSDEWSSALREALYNALSTVFRSTRLPRILQLGAVGAASAPIEKGVAAPSFRHAASPASAGSAGSAASAASAGPAPGARAAEADAEADAEAGEDAGADAQERLAELRGVVRLLVGALHELSSARGGDDIRSTLLRDAGSVSLALAARVSEGGSAPGGRAGDRGPGFIVEPEAMDDDTLRELERELVRQVTNFVAQVRGGARR